MLTSHQSAFPVAVTIPDVRFLLSIKNHGAAVIQRAPDIIMHLSHMLDKFILPREAGGH